MEYKDYYSTLGVERNASAEEIKRAYRKLVRKHHPDLSKDKNADTKTKELNEAYEVLGDADKRAAYDRLGSGMHAGQGFEPPPEWARSYGFPGNGTNNRNHNSNTNGGGRDFFSDLFAHVGRRGRTAFRTRGEDIRASIAIKLRDSYEGSARSVTLRVPEYDERGRSVQRERSVTVSIPKGVVAGQQLRLAGQGHPGSDGGAAGDLYLEVAFAPDPQYSIDGRDVTETVPVAPWEAALGAQVEVPTPSGRVTVAVPPGSQSGRKLRLKGRGIPAAPPGDLYLQLEVALPPANTARARELYETMARELPFNPRRHLHG